MELHYVAFRDESGIKYLLENFPEGLMKDPQAILNIANKIFKKKLSLIRRDIDDFYEVSTDFINIIFNEHKRSPIGGIISNYDQLSELLMRGSLPLNLIYAISPDFELFELLAKGHPYQTSEVNEDTGTFELFRAGQGEVFLYEGDSIGSEEIKRESLIDYISIGIRRSNYLESFLVGEHIYKLFDAIKSGKYRYVDVGFDHLGNELKRKYGSGFQMSDINGAIEVDGFVVANDRVEIYYHIDNHTSNFFRVRRHGSLLILESGDDEGDSLNTYLVLHVHGEWIDHAYLIVKNNLKMLFKIRDEHEIILKGFVLGSDSTEGTKSSSFD